MKTLTAQRLRELLDYDPETGIFRWRVVRRGCGLGKIAGTVHQSGYRQIRVDGCVYLSHRLAFLWMTGRWPVNEIDHIDGNKSNNRFANLREASRTLNAHNQRRAHSRSSSGLLGVVPVREKFEARIMANKKNHYLGTFPNAESAHAAYVIAKRKLHIGALAQ